MDRFGKKNIQKEKTTCGLCGGSCKKNKTASDSFEDGKRYA